MGLVPCSRQLDRQRFQVWILLSILKHLTELFQPVWVLQNQSASFEEKTGSYRKFLNNGACCENTCSHCYHLMCVLKSVLLFPLVLLQEVCWAAHADKRFLFILVMHCLPNCSGVYQFNTMWLLFICELPGCAGPWPSQSRRRELWFTAGWGCREASRPRPTPSTSMRSSVASTGSPSSYINSDRSATTKNLHVYNIWIKEMLKEYVVLSFLYNK